MPDAAVANLTTAILQQSPLHLAASSALSIISTFCLHNGTTLQEVIRAAPYYLLNDNTQTADILYANTSSYATTYAGATAAFHSRNTSNQANITLLADEEYGLGLSVATISANMSSTELSILTQTLLSSLTLSEPRVPHNDSFFSWSDYINGQKLNVTSLLPRATLNSHFNANSDGTCQAVVQAAVQRQGLWNVTGQCLAEIRSQGNTHHKLQHERATGNVYMAAQKFELSTTALAAPASGPSGMLTHSANVTDIQRGSPCTYTQANGTAVMPEPCSASCLLANGSAAQPTLSCTIGKSSDMTCTTCAGALGNIPLFDLEALPAASSNQSIYACTSDCNLVTYLTMLEGIPASLCNTSCIANEQSWAGATLRQAANKSLSCNATCQAQHDSFIAGIQAPAIAIGTSMQRRLQATTSCTPVQICILCDDPCHDPACNCSMSVYISASLVPFPATCGTHPAGTVFGPYDSGCPPEPPTPYVPPPIPGQCENPPAIFCSNCLNGNDLNGNPVNDATRCSDPIYDDPPPSGKIIRYLCNTCGESTVGLNHGECAMSQNGNYQCAGNG
ncbi:TPA: hypothetical protein ACH3X1_004585 [Trebouxia sp. C0004]